MGLLSTLGNIPENLRRVQKEFDTGDRNVLEYIVGTGYEGVGKPVGAALSVPIDALGAAANYVAPETTQAVKEAASDAFVSGMEAIGGDKALEWVEENIDPEYRRFGNELLGIVGAVPVGRMFYGNRPDELKGMALGSGNVLKKGHYNPEDVSLNALERGIGTVASTLDPTGMLRGTTGTNIANYYRQKKGTAEFLATGLGRVSLLAFNPVARAKYAEYGLTPVFDDVHKRYVKAVQSGDRKAIEDAVEEVSSQLQQMQHIRQQSGAKALVNDETFDFALASADEFVPEMYFTPKEKGHNWYYKTTEGAPQVRQVRKEDAEFIQQHFIDAWKGDGYDPKSTKIIVKTPRSQKVTGDHFNDVLANNPIVTNISDLFQQNIREGGKKTGKITDRSLKEFDSVDDLYNALHGLQKRLYKDAEGNRRIDKKTGKPVGLPFSLKFADDTGVWIEMSKAGTAKVEGGVNMLIKIEPNGDLTGVMSDLHNFYEQKTIKGVTIRNVPMKRALPNEVLAITRPMQTNIVSVSSAAGKKPKAKSKQLTDAEGKTLGKFGAEAESRRIPHSESAPIPDKATQKAARERIDRAGAVRPSMLGVAKQLPMVGANAVMTTGMLSGNPEEDLTINP